MPHTVEIRSVPSRTIAVTTFHVERSELESMGDRMSGALGTVAAHLQAAGAGPVGPAVASYVPCSDGFEVSAGFEVGATFAPTAGVELLVLPAGKVAHTTHVGGYDSLPEAYEDLRTGAEAQGCALLDGIAMWEEYWSGPDAPVEEIRTEIYWPVDG